MLGAGAIFGSTGLAGPAAIGMGAIGAGIAAFFVAFDGMAKLGGVLGADGSATKKLVNNMIDGIKPLENLDGDKLAGAAKVLPDIGDGISKFFGGEMMGKLSETASDIAGFVKNIFGFGDDGGSSKEKSRIAKMVEALEPLKGIDPDSMKGLNMVLDDLERLGKIRIQHTLGNNIKKFAEGLAKAMPALELALYGGDTKDTALFGNNSVKIRGLANGGNDLQLAVDALNNIMAAATGVTAAGGGGGDTIVNNVDNSQNGGGGTPAIVGSGTGNPRGHPSAGVMYGGIGVDYGSY